MTNAKKLKISFIVLIVLLVVLLIPTVFKIQVNKYVDAFIYAAIGVTFIFMGYNGAEMQLEKGKKRSAYIAMFITGYLICKIVEKLINLLI